MNHETVLVLILGVVILALLPTVYTSSAYFRGRNGQKERNKHFIPVLARICAERYAEGAGARGILHGDNPAASIHRNTFTAGSAAAAAYDEGFRKGKAFRQRLKGNASHNHILLKS